MSNSRLAALTRSDYTWAHNDGTTSPMPGDDSYRSVLRSTAPYTITSLQVNPLNQAIGGVITVTAAVKDSENKAAGDGILVTFDTDLGNISARSMTSDGIAMARLTSEVTGTAHISATTTGSGSVQNTATATFLDRHNIFLPLLQKKNLQGLWRVTQSSSPPIRP
jgi:hypothetical protein